VRPSCPSLSRYPKVTWPLLPADGPVDGANGYFRASSPAPRVDRSAGPSLGYCQKPHFIMLIPLAIALFIRARYEEIDMGLDLFFDYLGVRLNGPKAAGKKIVINLNFTDTSEKSVLILNNAALNHSPDRQDASADATLTLTRTALNSVILQESTFDDEIKNGEVRVDGSLDRVKELVSLLDSFKFWFNIVTP